MTRQIQSRALNKQCQFDILKVTANGIKPVCCGLNSQQLSDLIDELKTFGVYIAKYAGRRAS